METRYSPIGVLALSDPARARKRVLAAFRRAKACRADAARLLGIVPSTLRRLVARLGMAGELDAAEERATVQGWHHDKTGGWPKGRSRKTVEG